MSETPDPVDTELDRRQLAEQLLAQAKGASVDLVGPSAVRLTKDWLGTSSVTS